MSNQKNTQWFTNKILYPEECVKHPERVGGGGGGGGAHGRVGHESEELLTVLALIVKRWVWLTAE